MEPKTKTACPDDLHFTGTLSKKNKFTKNRKQTVLIKRITACTSSVIGKVHFKTKYLARISKFLDKLTMRTVGTSLIQCHYDYTCLSCYSGLTEKQKQNQR